MKCLPLFFILSQVKILGYVPVSLFDKVELHNHNENIQRDGKHIGYILAKTAVHAHAGLALMHDGGNLPQPIAV